MALVERFVMTSSLFAASATLRFCGRMLCVRTIRARRMWLQLSGIVFGIFSSRTSPATAAIRRVFLQFL